MTENALITLQQSADVSQQTKATLRRQSKQEAQLMLTTGSTRLAVNQGQQS